eukprot:jgi/Tetstr1/447720/TSEL_000022.t1
MAQSPLGSPLTKDRADGDEERADRGMAISDGVSDGDAFWEGDDEEREPTGFLSSLNGSDKDETGGEEKGHEGEEEQEPRLQGTIEGGAKEEKRGCTAREVEMCLERGMRLEDFKLLFNDLLVSMRRDRGSLRGSAAAKNRHALQDAVGCAVSVKVVEEAFCEEGVNVQDHNAALFKQFVDKYAPDGLRVQHLRADTANMK